MKTDFNRFAVLSTKADPPKNSWWADPKLQRDRKAFEQRLVTEEIRMLGSKFAGRTHDKGIREK